MSELTLADLEAQAENAEYVKNAQTDNMRIMHKMTKWQDAQYATYTNMMAYNLMQKNPKIRAKNQNRLFYNENLAPEKTDRSIAIRSNCVIDIYQMVPGEFSCSGGSEYMC